MHFQPIQLFHQWITQEIQYFNTTRQIFIADRQHEFNANDWTLLIADGFVQRLFLQIDEEYFTQEKVKKHQDQYKKKDNLLKDYWLALNHYLQTKHNKKINQTYLSLHTIPKKQLTSRDNSHQTNNSVNNSVIELLKLQFYLLVQKYNNLSSQQDEANNFTNQKLHQVMNETLASSNLIEENDSESVSSSFNHGEEINGSMNSILSIQNESDSFLIESKQEQQTHDELRDEEFLQRICSLSQQAQEYLVSVVESIEQQQLLQSCQSHENQGIISESFIYRSNETPSIHPSNQSFKKAIYKQIEQVNEQNQEMKQKIQQILEENSKLEKQLEDNQQEENALMRKINSYNDQKEELFEYLKRQKNITINSLEQFIQIVQHIQQENQLLQTTIAEIQQRNYELETQNAQKIHSINKNALQITKINDDITKFKTKIKGLKEDIQYLDQFVNGNNPHITAQMITSIHVPEFDQNQHRFQGRNINQQSFLFNNSLDLQATHSFANVLRENRDIYNKKITNKSNHLNSHNRVLTDSLTGYGPNRLSLQTSHKPSTHRKNHKSSFPPSDQQNMDPTRFEEDEVKMQDFCQFPSKSHSHISINYELREEEREIEEQKEKYKQDLVNSLEELYKEINDLTKGVAESKEENKALEKRNKVNEKKITQLKYLHEAFFQEANQL